MKEEKKNEIKHQLVTFIWKIKNCLRGVRNKIEMTIQWTLKTL